MRKVISEKPYIESTGDGKTAIMLIIEGNQNVIVKMVALSQLRLFLVLYFDISILRDSAKFVQILSASLIITSQN